MKTGILSLILAVLLINNVKSVIYNKLVFGSDDEILTPLFEPSDVKIAVSASHDHSRSSSKTKTIRKSKSSRTSKINFDAYGRNSLTKMNLDLPSIDSSNRQKPSEETIKFSLDLPSIQWSKKEEEKLSVKSVQENINFNIPFTNAVNEDHEQEIDKPELKSLILSRPEFKSSIAPKSEMKNFSASKPEIKSNSFSARLSAGRQSLIRPGTVIANMAPSGVIITGKPATVSAGTILATAESVNNPSPITDLAEIPFGSSSDKDEKQLYGRSFDGSVKIIENMTHNVISDSNMKTNEIKTLNVIGDSNTTTNEQKPAIIFIDSNIMNKENNTLNATDSSDEKNNEISPSIESPLSLNMPVAVTKQKKIKALEENTINTMQHDLNYDGPKIDLKVNITVDFVNSTLIPFFKSGKILDRKSAYSVIEKASRRKFL